MNSSSKNYQLRKPTYLGAYGVKKKFDDTREYLNDVNDLYSIYNLEKFNEKKFLDLKEGFKGNEKEIKPSGSLDELLIWVLNNKEIFQSKLDKDSKIINLNTDFICYRGCLSQLLKLSYDAEKPFTIQAQKFHNTIYFKYKSEEESYPNENLFSYCGRQFEKFCCKKLNENVNNDLLKDPSAIYELVFVHRSRISNHSLVYGAEMDCFLDYKELKTPRDSDAFNSVELKTSKKPKQIFQETTFKKKKCLRWWSQSILVNIKKIACGYWDHDQIVNEIQEYTLNDLENLGKSYWVPNECYKNLNFLLSFIKKIFEEKKTNLITFYHQRNSFTYEESFDPILPEFYTKEFSKFSNIK